MEPCSGEALLASMSSGIFIPCRVSQSPPSINRRLLQFTMKFSIAALLLSTVSLASAEDAALRDIVTLGTRPYYLVEEMKDGELKNALSEEIPEIRPEFCLQH